MKSNILVSALMSMIPQQNSLQGFLNLPAIGKPSKNWSGVFNGKRECARRQKQMASKAVQ